MRATLISVILALISFQMSWAQCDEDRHSTNIHESWLSCTQSNNPNSSRPNSHWIMYDLGQPTELYKSTIWNLNHPKYLNNGLQLVAFDYSTNGFNWTNFGNEVIPQAPGTSFYEGVDGPDFDGITARYVLLTGITNHGGDCYGLSEIRIYTEPGATNPNNLLFSLNACENEGIHYNLQSGMTYGGTFTGNGVVNSYNDSFDFNPNTAGPGTHTIIYTFTNDNGQTETKTKNIIVKSCADASCPPCENCLDEPQITYDSDPVPNGIFWDPTIQSSGTVTDGFDISYHGEQEVELLNDFEAKANSYFLADIRDCNEDYNFLSNGDFESGVSPWLIELHNGSAATQTTSSFNAYEGTSSARVSVSNSTGVSWNIQYKHTGLSLNAGQQYRVSFAARSNISQSIYCGVSNDVSPYNGYGGSTVLLNSNWQNFTFLVTPNEDNLGNVRLSFSLGYTDPATYWFDAVELKIE